MRPTVKLIAALAGLAAAFPAAAAGGAFGRPAVSDSRLGGMRGGFLLPGGLDVALTVQSVTQLNGRMLFKTEFAADEGPAELNVSNGSRDLDVRVGGGGVRTGGGNVEAVADRGGTRITYSARGLDVTHLAGIANGSIIANQRNGVSIDTATNVDLTLRNATPLNLGSTLLRVDSIAVDVATRLAR